MGRTTHALSLIGLLALLTASCGLVSVSGSVQVTAVAVGPGTPLPAIPFPNAQPTPILPEIFIEYNGSQAASLEQYATWQGGFSAGGGNPGPGAHAALAVPQGASLDIVFRYPRPPAVVLVAELDSQGAPLATTTISAPSNVVTYTPSGAGQYRLQVTAEWTYQNTVTSIFDLTVQPPP